ncbi:MAG: hypothetical protein ACR2PM_08360 [Hyphomicrobiales bacterium]
MKSLGNLLLSCLMAAVVVVCAIPAAYAGSALSDKPIPMVKEQDVVKLDPPRDEVGPRAAPPIEIGPEFLNTGNLEPGIELPTGAIWTPSLWMFGDYRTGIGYFDNRVARKSAEWAHRLDLFFNLQLSGTERVLLGFTPIHDNNSFTRHQFLPSGVGTEIELNGDIETLFFEGEFGEIFPRLDPTDAKGFDIGFSIGRQPIFFQEGMMFNDIMDGFAVTRDTIVLPGVSPDMRATFLFSWGNIHRDDNTRDRDAYIFGLFTETDLRKSTVNVDMAYTESSRSNGGDSGNLGISAIQRIGHYNTAFRANGSVSFERDSLVADDGVLLFAEVSRTRTNSENIIYVNAFWGIENYSSAARGPTTGGPLGQTGLLFSAVGLGSFGAPLGNRADDSIGAVLGHQWFFDHERTQLVLEVGGRQETTGPHTTSGAVGGRLQFGLADRYILQFDGFVVGVEDNDVGGGVRSEFRVRF